MKKQEFEALVEEFGLVIEEMITPSDWNRTKDNYVIDAWKRHITDPNILSKLNIGLDYENYIEKSTLPHYLNNAFLIIALNLAIDKDAGLKALKEFYNDFFVRLLNEIKLYHLDKPYQLKDLCGIGRLLNVKEKPKKEQQPQKKEEKKAAAVDSTPTEHDLWMFELGRRQALGENYQGPLNPQQQQMILQQDSQTESPITSPQDKSNLSPKLVTQKEMISCIKEFTSQFPAIYGEKFIKEIMEKDSCTLKGHGHDYIKLYQACHGADAVSDNQLTNRIILEIDWIYSYKEFMADIGELFVEYTLKHMPSSEQFMKNDD